MENPASLLRRARQNKHRKAPVSAPAAETPGAIRAAGHTSSHANYTALMRSHDRVATRHIAPGNGA